MAGFLVDKGRRILFNGYNVIPIKRGGKAPSIKNWETIQTTETDIQRWISNGRAQDGVGITTATTPLVDLDISDPEMNRKVADWTFVHIGLPPVRIGNAPKRGLLFRSSEPFRKITSRAFTDPEGRKAQVEILGDGQQFVAYHIHPDTHKPYRWLGHDSPELLRVADLPELSQEQGRAIVGEFERLATEAGWPERRHSTLPALSSDDDPFGIGTEPVGLTDDELRGTVMVIPNQDVDYDAWVAIGMAVWHETGGSDYGHDLWLEWSDQALKHNDEKFEKSWNSFGKNDDTRRPVTARLLLKLAKEARAAERTEQVSALVQRFAVAKDIDELRGVAAECRKIEVDLIDRSRLVNALQKAVKAATGGALGVREAREMVRYRPEAAETPEWLEGWCYLTHAKQFYSATSGERIEREAFDAAYGRFLGTEITASKYALDTVKIPVYHMTIYLPAAEEVFTDPAGLTWINTYTETFLPLVPAQMSHRDTANVEIVEKHAHHLFDDTREIEIFHSWLAHIVQTRKRPNWAVILQGAEGTGKSFYASLMAAVLGGPHVYILGADTLQRSDFTAWAEGHMLVFIEELKQHGHNSFDIPNKLKPYITNPSVEIHPKRINPYNVPNTTAYLAGTNYRDALPLGQNDSRYFIMMSRWQQKTDIDAFKNRNPTYYRDLFAALDESPGAIRKWLLDYKLHPDFNPADRAPPSHGKEAMIEEAKSDEQHLIEDLIAEKAHPLVSDDLIVVHILRELAADDIGRLDGLMASSVGVRRIMERLGYTSRPRIKINGERFYLWARSHELINADAGRLREIVQGRLEKSNPL